MLALWNMLFTTSKFKKMQAHFHKMMHIAAPTQQDKSQRGIIQGDICFFCNDKIKSLH